MIDTGKIRLDVPDEIMQIVKALDEIEGIDFTIHIIPLSSKGASIQIDIKTPVK